MSLRSLLVAALCWPLLLGGCKGKQEKPHDAATRKDLRAKPKPPPPDLLRTAENAYVAGDKHNRLRKMFDGDAKTSFCFATAKRTARVWLWLPAGVAVRRLDLTFAAGTKSPDIEGGKLHLERAGLTLAEHTVGKKRAEKGVQVKLGAPAKGGAIFTLKIDGLTGCVSKLAMRGAAPPAARRAKSAPPEVLEGELPKLACPGDAEVGPPHVKGGTIELACVESKGRGHGPFVRWSRGDGFLREHGTLVHGKRHGRSRVYAEGKLVVEGNYDSGTKQGIWRRANERLHIEELFDENGQRTTMGPPPASVHPALEVAKISRKNLVVHARMRLDGARDVVYLVRDNAPEAALAKRRPRSKTGQFYVVSAKRALPLFKQLWKVVRKTDLEPANTSPKITADPLDTDGREAIIVRLSYKALGENAPEFIIALPCINLLARLTQKDTVKITGSGTTRQVEVEHTTGDDDKSVRPIPVPSRDACPLTTAPAGGDAGDGAAVDGSAAPSDGAVKPVKASAGKARRRRRHRRGRRRRRRRPPRK